MLRTLFALLLGLAASLLPAAQLSIQDNRFLLDGDPLDIYGIRVASAIGTEAYTDHLIDQLDDYRAHGVNAVTVFYMGSSGGHYDPFTSDGTGFRYPAFAARMDRIVEACDARGMVVIVGIFYQWKNQELTDRSLSGWNASKEAVRTVAARAQSKGHRNVIINIANEQNSTGYSGEPWERVRNVDDLLEMVRIAKAAAPDVPVGCGGYSHSQNKILGLAPEVDTLLFDTLGPESQEHSGHWHDYFVANGIRKPLLNVEIFGGWTKMFTPQGVYPADGKESHYREIADAAARPGLGVFFHSNPWCQGPSVGEPVRFDLAGRGSSSDPGIRWWFERVRDTIAGGGSDPDPDPNAPGIDGLQLVDADSNTVIGPLVDGAVIDLDGVGSISVVAVGNADTASVVFDLDGQTGFRTENSVPYALFGDASGDYHPWPAPLGSHSLTVRPYSESNAGGTAGTPITISFSVVEGGGNQAPVARVSAIPVSGVSPLTVTLDASASSDADGSIVSYSWNLGDGSSASGAVVSHTYSSPDDGTFNAICTVTDDKGASDSANVVITISGESGDTGGQAPFGGSPFPVSSSGSSRLEAEDYDLGGEGVGYHDSASGNQGGAYRSDGVDIQSTSDAGGGYNVAWIASGEWLEYHIDVAEAGSYDLELRVARQHSGSGALHVEIAAQNLSGSVAVPSTGGWQTWTTISTPIDLTAGEQVLRLAMDSSSFNLNWIAFSRATSTTAGAAINMQPASAPTVDGYLLDHGAAFAERGNGHSYGWNTTVAEARDRNSSNAPDQIHDTLNHMQKSGADHRWEMAVSDGLYEVTVLAGDPSYTNSVYRIAVEGSLAIDAVPNSSQRWFEASVVVEVTDGRLSITNAAGAQNNKLMAVTVIPLPAGDG